MSDNWCTIESDPGVFTELIQNFGVEGVQVEELYTLDEMSFAELAPVYGLVFLFKWQSEQDPRPVTEFQQEPHLFFASQVIQNACATQALLSILLNVSGEVEIGPTLREFKSFTAEFPPDIKGLAMSNSSVIRTVHNSFARQDPFVIEESKSGEKEDAFHFIAYVPFEGKVYELDGLKPGPILLGEGEDWLAVARPAIQARIERYASSEIRFNLLSLIKNRKLVAEEQIAKHEKRLGQIHAAFDALSSGGSVMAVSDPEDPGFLVGSTPDELGVQQSEEVAAIDDLRKLIASEEKKFKTWREENIRRKHNYIPFVMNLLKVLAERGQLKGMVESAKKRVADERARESGKKVSATA